MAEEVPVDLSGLRGRAGPPAGAVPPRPVRPQPAPEPPKAKPEPDQAKQEPAKAEAPHPVNCKHCGWNQADDPVAASPEDAERFRAAVFAGELFTRTAELVGGAVSVRIRDLTADEEEAVKATIVAEVLKTPVTPVEMFERFTDLRMGLAVEQVRLGDKWYRTERPEAVDGDVLRKRFTDLRSRCGSQTVYGAVRWEYVRFVAVVGQLLSRAGDPSFFSATGSRGASPASPSAP